MSREEASANSGAASSPPPARIRPYNGATDLKVVRYLVGAQVMEPSSRANQAALFSPFILILWAIFTHVAVVYLGRGWPSSLLRLLHLAPTSEIVAGGSQNVLQHVTEYLSLLPLVVSPPIVLLALFEMRHRNLFEDEMTRAIGEEDMRDIEGYYGVAAQQEAGAKSGFWVLEFEGRIIGAMGLDARKPGQHLDAIMDGSAGKVKTLANDSESPVAKSSAVESQAYALRSRDKTAKAVSTPNLPASTSAATTLHLRRFATSLSFCAADIEDDLLEFLAKFTFASSASPAPTAIVTTLRPSVEKSLARRLAKHGWREAARDEVAYQVHGGAENGKGANKRSAWASAVDKFWPLALDRRAWVLVREKVKVEKATSARQEL